MFSQSWSRWLRRWRDHLSGRRQRRRVCYRPQLEQLEGRVVPSATDPHQLLLGTFSGTTGNSFSATANPGDIVSVPLSLNNLNPSYVFFTGNTHSNITVDGIASTAGLAAGQAITGPGIPINDTILDVGNHSITLSIDATATATGVALTANPDQISWADFQISFDATRLSVGTSDITLPSSFMANKFTILGTGVNTFNGSDATVGTISVSIVSTSNGVYPVDVTAFEPLTLLNINFHVLPTATSTGSPGTILDLRETSKVAVPPTPASATTPT